MKEGKPFFFRIDLIELMDFATEPDGEKMSLLQFAKELKRGQSDIPQIQKIINEAREFISKKKDAAHKRWNAPHMQTDAPHMQTDAPHMPCNARTEAEAVTETIAEAKKKEPIEAGADSGKPSRPKRASKISDEEWLEAIKVNPAYEGIDIARLKAKMEAWCMTKGKQPTRARLLNWLNREERPMVSSPSPAEDGPLPGETSGEWFRRKCAGSAG